MAVGTVCQIVLLPLLGLSIAWLVPLQPQIAVGLIVLAVCAGEPSSKLVTYLAKGDVALCLKIALDLMLRVASTSPTIATLSLIAVGRAPHLA